MSSQQSTPVAEHDSVPEGGRELPAEYPEQSPLQAAWQFVRRDPYLRCFAFYFLLSHAPYLVPGLSDQQLELIVNRYVHLGMVPLLIFGLTWRLREIGSRTERELWVLLASAYVFWWLYTLLALVYPAVVEVGPGKLVSDGLFALYYMCWLLASALVPHLGRGNHSSHWVRGLRVTGALVFASGLLVYFIVVPSGLQADAFAAWVPSLYMYVVLDLLLTLRLGSLALSAQGRWRMIYSLLAGSTCLMAVLDLLEGLTYQGVLDLTDPRYTGLWNLQFVPLVLAARLRFLPAGGSQSDQFGVEASERMLGERSPLVLAAFAFPLLHIGLHHFSVLDTEAQGAREGVALFCLAVLGLLAMVEHRLLLRQTQRAEAAQRELEEARIAKVIAEEADREKSRFLGHVSHEIRTPMNGILGMAWLLLQGRLDTPQRHQAEILKASADGLLQVIDDMLEFSHLESGDPVLEPRPTSVQQAVSQVVELFEPSAAEQGVDLSLRLHPGLPDRVMVDASRLRQVLLNLVSNALKFTPDGGQVVVDLQAISPGRQVGRRKPARSRIRFTVLDNGIGINEEAQSRLFVPFAQAEESTSRDYGGSGLGLAISQRWVQAMGGSIQLHSQPGAGSSFWFDLPLQVVPPGVDAEKWTPRSTNPAGAPEAAGPGRSDALLSGRILLVEDNLVNRMVTANQLRALGLEPDLARDGREALRSLAARPYDLVLMDCQMPVMNGYEATRAWREHEAHVVSDQGSEELAAGTDRQRRIPVVAVTALAYSRDRQRCLDAGMDDVLAKPFDEPQLREMLGRWLKPAGIAGQSST